MSENYESLLKRVQDLEDYRAIQTLVTQHPISVDCGAKESWLANWTDDAVVSRKYDPERHSGDYKGTYGKDVMLEELRTPELAALRKAGMCHFTTPAHINITGDTAVATNYLVMIGMENNALRLRRLVLTNWHFRRENGVWKISERAIRPLGDEDFVKLAATSLPYGAE